LLKKPRILSFKANIQVRFHAELMRIKRYFSTKNWSVMARKTPDKSAFKHFLSNEMYFLLF